MTNDMDSVPNMEASIWEKVQLDAASGRTPAVTICSSLAILLSTYRATPTALYHARASPTSEPIWDVGIEVDPDCSVDDFLDLVETSDRHSRAPSAPWRAFCLRTDSLENWQAHEQPFSAIPSQISCIVEETSHSLRSLRLSIPGESSPAHARFIHQLAYITEQLLATTNRGRSLKDLDLICDLDRGDLQRRNQSPPSTIASTVHETFRQRVSEAPASQAVESWDGSFSYLELDDLSSRVCTLLLEAGAHHGDVIPVCFEKSRWAVAAMLGILKSGCSFLLMDVSHPTARLQTLTSETKATIVLCSVAQEDRAAELGARAMVISARSLSAVAENKRADVEAGPFDVAATIFTSGTTGTPKAIQLEHKSLCSTLPALAKLANIGRHTRYFQFVSYAFDVAFGETLMTLTHGGCLCIPSEADRLNNLAKAITSFNANVTFLTPTIIQLLSPSDVRCLTTLITGGEKVTQDLVELWGTKLDLANFYGPAEATFSCVAKIASPRDDGDTAVRIGFPVNGRSWIARIDNPRRLAPIGAIGELVAEGPGIARGYLNNTSGNRDLFLASPPWANEWESTVPSMGRSYRTGDLVRYADDGEIIFIGRRDRQVKLRGQRIELEEIETQLRRHLQLSEANTLVEVIDVQGTANMVAFIHHPSLKDAPITREVELEIEGLRARISKVFAAWMCPVAWIPLREVPLGPTGKLDRRKLTSLGEAFFSSISQTVEKEEEEEDHVLSSTESILGRLWKQLLPSAEALAPNTDFFQLGGDSLRCMRLVAMANREGFDLTMEQILQKPTLSSMAAAMQPLHSGDIADTSQPSIPNPLDADVQSDRSILPSLKEYGLDAERVASVFPCTPLQAGLFSLSLAMPSLYSGQFVFDFSAAADTNKFKTAWESAIDTFPILRTSILPSSSGLVQVVSDHHDQWTEVQQDLASFLTASKDIPFQFGEPLSRPYYVRDPTSGQSHFVWVLHHAAYDGWSLEPVVDHIRRKYFGSTSEAEDPAGSFQEFAQFCQSLDADACTSFWKGQLMNAPMPSFPSPPRAGHLAIDKSSLQYTMAAPAVVTTTTTVLARASWALLLSEYEGSDDVVFGNTLHGRNSLPHKLQDAVGPALTTLPVRVRIDPSQTVSGFLEGLQRQMSAMIPCEQFGLSRIMGIDQGIRNSASFRTLLIVQVADEETLEDQGIRLREVERGLHEYPLVLTLFPGRSQIHVSATFDSDVIAASQVQRIVEQFGHVFEQLNAVPRDTKVSELELASKVDQSTMFEWNARHHVAYEVCVHEWIKEQARHSQASPAIYSRDGTMDYATLDGLSDCVAGELMRAGVEPGNAVGILFEKSQWAIVSILAAIKAGAVFAPFSPAYPRVRLEAIAKDAGIGVVLCSPLQEKAFPNPPWRTIVVSSDAAQSFATPTQVRRKVATPDSLLYILSTSGTTGTPKIFGVQHKSFATGAIARAPLLRRGPNSRVLQFAPYAFDPSVEDILTTLMFGGCICVPSDDDVMGDITAFMKAAQVNFANITPSVAYTLRQDELPDLKILLLSGEAPDQALVDKWDGLVQLMNGYGPSECSVKCAINCNLSRHDPKNIGHRAGTSIWVLRPGNHNQITPIGAVGELVIESPHLATGYMNRPEANADKFITSPRWLRDFRDGHITRMYKTGDLVRCMEDGSISYIGRGDMQLKLQGQRLEGEEVRQRIQESLVDTQLQVIVDIARFEGQDSDLLVAYLAEEGARGSEIGIDHILQQNLVNMKEHIISHVSTALPKYMIPSVFLALTSIPVTANGKTDRRALKAFAGQQRLGSHLLSGKEDVQPPSSMEEKLLHGMWHELLGLNRDQFGANSHFFEVGGSSIAAIKLSAAARELGYDLPAQMIIKNPVLSAMAAQMVVAKEVKTTGPARFGLLGKVNRSVYQLNKALVLLGIDEKDVEDAYPLTRQQQRYIDGEMMSPGGTTHRHLMQLPTNIDLHKLEIALRRVVEATPILRTRIITVASQLVQVVLKQGPACRHFDNLSSLAAEDRKTSWFLNQPLSRLSIVDGGPNNRWLAWSAAHVVFDGWCRKLLLEEIDFAYHHSDYPPKRPHYNKYIEYIYGSRKDDAAITLMEELKSTKFLNYFPIGSTQVPGVTHTLSLDIEFPVALPAGISYPTAMLTAWATVASHVEKHDHLLFNLLLGGRDAKLAGVDKVLGPVSSTGPFAPCIDRDSTFRRNMELVQQRIDDAGRVMHVVRLGDALERMLAAVPTVVVHPAEDYEEAATQHLRLSRTRAEPVKQLVDTMFMNFCLQPDNAGVSLVMTIDSSFFPEDKAVRYMGYLECVLKQVFSSSGLDRTIRNMDLSSSAPTSSVAITTEMP